MYLNSPLMDSKVRHKDYTCWRNNGNAFRTHDNKTNTAALAVTTTTTTKTETMVATTTAIAAAEASIQFQFIIKFAIFFVLAGAQRRRTLTLPLGSHSLWVFNTIWNQISARISFQTTVVMDTSQTMMKSENRTFGIFNKKSFWLHSCSFYFFRRLVSPKTPNIVLLLRYWLNNWHHANAFIEPVEFNKNNM